MLNKSAATDARHSRSGKDAMLYNSAGKPFAQVESFTTKGSFNTKNRRQGIRVADELDMPKYRASLIYNSTTEEDKAKLWDNPAVKKGLDAKGICIINALDVIDAVLLPGEKDRIMDIIDDVNGFNNEELKAETAKN